MSQQAWRSAVASLAVLGTVAAGTGCVGRGSGTSAASETTWLYHGQQGITAQYEVADATLYRQLLPSQLGMPERLVVAVAVVLYDDVRAPLAPYHEGYVLLACTYGGRKGWYTVTMPVDDQVAHDGGRAMGFDKYLADRIDLAESGGVWSGRVVKGGGAALEMTFTPSAVAQLLVGKDGELPPLFNLLPPATGPDVAEVQLVVNGERRVESLPGVATVSAGAGEPWGALLVGSPPAVHERITGEWTLQQVR